MRMNSCCEVLLSTDASGQMFNVCVWDIDSGTGILTYKGNTTAPRTLALIADQYLVGATPNKQVLNVWGLQKRDHMHMKMVCPGRVTALDVTLDGMYCIAGISEKIHVWQTCSGRLLTVLSQHYQNICCIKCSDDGTFFITGGDDNLVIAWSLPQVLSESNNQGIKASPLHIWSDHSLPITDICLGVGGCVSRVLSSSLDQTCRMWDMNSGEPLFTLLFDVPIYSVTMDTTELRLYAGGSNGKIYSHNLFGNSTKDYNIQTEKKDTVGFDCHEKQVTCLCMSLDGNKLISGSHDNTVKVWDVFSGQCLRTLHHKGPITNLCMVSIPPGIVNPELKSTFPLQNFQCHLNQSRDEKGDHSVDTLNVLLQNDKRDNKSQLFSVLSSSVSGEDITHKNKEEELTKLRSEVKSLKATNTELYQYIANDLLYKGK